MSALSTQLYELQVVSEKRLAAAAAEAQAALRAEHLELQAEITSLAAKLAAETRKRQEFETEVSGTHLCSYSLGTSCRLIAVVTCAVTPVYHRRNSCACSTPCSMAR